MFQVIIKIIIMEVFNVSVIQIYIRKPLFTGLCSKFRCKSQ